MVFTQGFGLIFCGIMNGHNSQGGIPDINNVLRTVFIYNLDINNGQNFMANPVKQFQLGKGTTPASPLDFNIETPFITAPESSRIGMSEASYILNSGEITQTGFISNLGSSDSFTEICFFTQIRDTSGGNHIVMISRIIVDPPEPFLLGNRVDVEHKVNI